MPGQINEYVTVIIRRIELSLFFCSDGANLARNVSMIASAANFLPQNFSTCSENGKDESRAT